MKETEQMLGCFVFKTPRKISFPEALKISHQSRFKVWFTPNPPSNVMQSQLVTVHCFGDLLSMCMCAKGSANNDTSSSGPPEKSYPLEVR